MTTSAGSPVARLDLYTEAARKAAAVVIGRYSTSFGVASSLLGSEVRRDVEVIYALVRVADEIVDGAALEAGLDVAAARNRLDAMERETELAMATGFSTDLIVHAFATTARSAGFGSELTGPFFASMRADLSATEHTQQSFNDYVYGSAEVVGLMCLRVFLRGQADADLPRLERGARALGAAFQKVNFLRDLAADFGTLGRSYFPGITVTSFTEAEKIRLLDDIDADLAVSAQVVPQLPASSRRAVALAQSLFTELSARLRQTPAAEVASTRIRVPDPVKLRLLLAARIGRMP